jgi:dihydroxyacetone kinase-like predicted kinase
VVIDEAASVGRLRNVSVENMELQHEGARSASVDGASDIGIVTVAPRTAMSPGKKYVRADTGAPHDVPFFNQQISLKLVSSSTRRTIRCTSLIVSSIKMLAGA